MRRDPRADPTARPVHRRGYQKAANYVRTSKVSGVAVTESALEAGLLHLAELDPRVLRAFPQPWTLDLETGEIFDTRQALQAASPKGSRARCYTPDFELRLMWSSVLVECKHSRLLQKDPERARDVEYGARVVGYRLIRLDESILTGPTVLNAQLLHPYVARSIAEPERAGVVAALRTPKAFGEVVSEARIERATALGLIAQGHVAADLGRERLGPRTTLRLDDGTMSYLQVLPI